MLGHYLTFSYCRQTDSSQPCRKIFDCWFEKLDIEQFIKENFTEEQITALLAPPKPKMVSLVELIRQAQKNARTNEHGE
jgi:hypothetical protein